MIKLLKSAESRAISALLLIIFIDSLGYMVTIPVFLRLLLDPTLSYLPSDMSQASRNILFSFAIAVGPFGYMIGAPLMGTWSDFLGRKRTLILSLILGAIGFLLPILGILYHSLVLILVGRFLGGLASSSQSISQSAIGDISKGTQKAWYFSLVAIAMTLSLLIGPSMGGYLSDPHGLLGQSLNHLPHHKILLLAAPFVTTMILMAIALWLTTRYYDDQHHFNQPAAIFKLSNFKNAISEAATPSIIRRLFMIFFFYELGWSFYYQDISLYLTQRFDYTVTEMSYFMTYTGVFMALGLIFCYKYLVKHFQLHSILKYSLLVCVIFFTGCTLSPISALQWFLIIPATIAVGVIYPTIMTLLSNEVPSQKQGWILGFAAAAFSAPWGVSALLIGPLTNISVSLPLVIAVGSFLAAYFLRLNLHITQSKAQI